MEKSGANAYIYARLSGMLGKSFVGPRAARLFGAATLSDLWTMVFHTEVPLIPQMMLSQKIERDAERRFVSQYISLIEVYDKIDPLLLELLRFYEVEDLKAMGAALCSNEKEKPPFVDLGEYGTLKHSAWPDIAAVTAASPFAWYDKVPSEHEQRYVHVKLDNQYVARLWEAAHKVSREIRSEVVAFFENEAAISNAVWALRLRVYYGMEKEEVMEHLACARKADKTDALAGDAVKMLDWPIDSWEAWQHWKYAGLLNPHEDDTWSVDPRWVENESRAQQYKAAMRLFHAKPLTELSLIAWFRIKQRECDMIRTAAEGIKLSAPSDEIMAMAGVANG